MPTLTIEGREVTVGDDFLAMTPEQQNAAVDEIANSLGVSAPSSDKAGQPTGQAGQAAQAFNPGLGVARDLVEGIPILGPLYAGAVDQLTSRAIGAVTGEDPQAMMDRRAAKHEAYQEENPILSTAAQITGGAVAMAPIAGTAMGAKLLGIAPEMALGARVGAGLGSGAVISGADTLVRGGTPQEAMLNAGIGGALGGAFGAAAPVIAPVAQKAVNAGRGTLASIGIGAKPAVPSLPYNPTAQKAVSRVLAGDDALGQSGMLNVAEGGPRAMMADAGPGAQSLLDTAIQRSGPGARDAVAAIDQRAIAANRDVQGALDTYLGKPRGVQTMQTELRTGTSASRKKAYDAAYAQPIDYASEKGRSVEGLMKRVPQDVINTANRMMQLEGQKSAQILARVADDGTVQYVQMPDVRQIDYITRALNQAAKSGDGQGALGGQTDIGRIYGNLARDIRDAARIAAPAYDDALKVAANPIQLRQAMEFGTDILKPQTARDAVAETFGAMTPPERDAAKIALRGHLDELFANTRTAITNPHSDIAEARKALGDLSSRAAMEKIQTVLADPSDFAAFWQQMSEARRALEMRAAVAGNSRTAARLMADDAVQSQIRGGVLNAAKRGEPVNVGRSIVQNITGRTPQGEQAMSDAIYADIAKMLTTQGPEAISLMHSLGHNAAQRPPVATMLPGAAAPSAEAVNRMLGLN
jgi:hypothetical protein